jgi:hypothetical protein
MDARAAQLDKLGLNAFGLQFAQHVSEQDRRIPALAGAPVKRNNFHLYESRKTE